MVWRGLTQSLPTWPPLARKAVAIITRTRAVEATGEPGRQQRTPIAPAVETHLLVRQVLSKEDVDDLRHYFAGALIELLLGKVGDRVRHRQIFIIWDTPGLCHGPTGGLEHIRDDGSGWQATFFKHYAVEHTARAARASISHPSDDDIALGQDIANDFLMGGDAGTSFAPQQHAFDPILILENLADF